MTEHFASFHDLNHGIAFPPALAGKFRIDLHKQRIICNGYMTESEYDVLRTLDRNADYQQAVERLFQISRMESNSTFATIRGWLKSIMPDAFCAF